MDYLFIMRCMIGVSYIAMIALWAGSKYYGNEELEKTWIKNIIIATGMIMGLIILYIVTGK